MNVIQNAFFSVLDYCAGDPVTCLSSAEAHAKKLEKAQFLCF